MNKRSQWPKRRPSTTPLAQWPEGWLVLECASLLDIPSYIAMHQREQKANGLPSTIAEMRAFIAERHSGKSEPVTTK